MRNNFVFRNNLLPDIQQIADLYKRASLNRPVDDVNRLSEMYKGSNLIISVWDKDKLIAIMRGWTDGAYDGYICDLAVDPEYQKIGIGKELLDEAIATYPKAQFVLRASVIATEYYKHIGWQKIENGWFFPREDKKIN